MIEVFRYVTPKGLELGFSLPWEIDIALPNSANEKLTSILALYNRTISSWNAQLASYVFSMRNFPFAIIYFNKEYPLAGYITSNRWDRNESPFQSYAYPPDPNLRFAGCWWFRKKEYLEYAAQRSSLAALAWEQLFDRDENTPWVVFMDELEPDFVSTAGKLNDNLAGLRKMDADFETTFPFNGEELGAENIEFSQSLLGGPLIWYTSQNIFNRLEAIMGQYQKVTKDLIIQVSNVYNTKRIKPWLTICLEREHDLAAYFFNDCGLVNNDIKVITYTDDYNITPCEFGNHIPFGIIYFVTKEDAQRCAKKSSLIGSWWERVKELREDRGWMITPSEDLRIYEKSDLFITAGKYRF